MASGGTMAGMIAHDRRDLFRGMILLDSNLSRRIERIEASPVNPLLVFLGVSNQFQNSIEFENTKNLMAKSKLPFTTQQIRATAPETWIPKIVLWADAVDRL